jgi:hypothetical protein
LTLLSKDIESHLKVYEKAERYQPKKSTVQSSKRKGESSDTEGESESRKKKNKPKPTGTPSKKAASHDEE